MKPSTTVRPVAERELEALCAMDHQIFGRLAYPRFVLQQLFDVFPQEIFVAETAGRLHGYSIAVPSTTPGLACFLALGVDVNLRGNGLGRRLALNAIAHLRNCGIERVSLVVEPHNTVAISLYKSLGFVQHGRLRDDYYGPGEHRLYHELSLVADTSPNGNATAAQAAR